MKRKTLLLGLVIGAFAAGNAFAADVTGHWKGEVKLPNGNALPFEAELHQHGEAVMGKLAGINGAPDVEIKDGKVQNDRLTFSGSRQINNAEVKFNYVGDVTADAINLQILRDDGQAAPLSTHLTRAAGG